MCLSRAILEKGHALYPPPEGGGLTALIDKMEQPIDKLAQKVADQFEERKNEDIDAWAERLAEEVSKHSDADEE